jgi:predicted phage tail protein
MTFPTSDDPDARRAYRQELRNVARLLRWCGIALALVGAIGIARGGGGAWFCFAVGWALVLCGVVQRVRPSARSD